MTGSCNTIVMGSSSYTCTHGGDIKVCPSLSQNCIAQSDMKQFNSPFQIICYLGKCSLNCTKRITCPHKLPASPPSNHQIHMYNNLHKLWTPPKCLLKTVNTNSNHQILSLISRTEDLIYVVKLFYFDRKIILFW